MHWYFDVLKKYAVFKGRSQRKEYWLYNLFSLVLILVLYGVGTAIGSQVPLLLYVLAVFLPSLAVTVRRLHDTGKSGWAVLVYFIPLIGGIVLLVFAATDGDQGHNAHGPDPRSPVYS